MPLNNELICDIASEFQSLKGYADVDVDDALGKDGMMVRLVEKFYKFRRDPKKTQKLVRQMQAVYQGNLEKCPELLQHESSLKLLKKINSKTNPSNIFVSASMIKSEDSPKNKIVKGSRTIHVGSALST